MHFLNNNLLYFIYLFFIWNLFVFVILQAMTQKQSKDVFSPFNPNSGSFSPLVWFVCADVNTIFDWAHTKTTTQRLFGGGALSVVSNKLQCFICGLTAVQTNCQGFELNKNNFALYSGMQQGIPDYIW